MSISSYILTTVTIPAVTNDLGLVSTILDDWNIDAKDIAFVSRSLTRCSVAAANFCNRNFGIATYSNLVRLERGYKFGYLYTGQSSPIMVPQWPIVSVVSVTETDPSGTTTVLVEGTDFEADYTTGKFYRLDSAQQPRDWYPRNEVTIVCQSGYVLPGQSAGSYPGASALPVDIEDAVGRMVYSRWAERGRDPFVKAETVEGIGRIEFIVGNPTAGDGGNMPPDVADLLNNYRVPITG